MPSRVSILITLYSIGAVWCLLTGAYFVGSMGFVLVTLLCSGEGARSWSIAGALGGVLVGGIPQGVLLLAFATNELGVLFSSATFATWWLGSTYILFVSLYSLHVLRRSKINVHEVVSQDA